MIALDTLRISNPVTINKKTSRGHSYEVLNCDGDMLCFDDHISGLFRSVVCDPLTHHIRAYAPRRSISLDQFRGEYPDAGPADWSVTETIEGTMINLFYDPKAERWEIATRGSVGGDYWFNRLQYSNLPEAVSQKTFRQMFVEALHGEDNLDDIPGIEHLDKSFSYSFVLQHPHNHMVYTVHYASATLVAIYEIVNRTDAGEESIFDGENGWNTPPRVRHVPLSEREIWANTASYLACHVSIPMEHVTSYDEYANLVNKTAASDHDMSIYCPVGWMLTHHASGQRVSLDNPHYVRLRKLRGNHPNLQFQYLCLYREKKVSEFLSWFPMYKGIFYDFYTQYHSFITEVHNAYISYYVLKENRRIAKKYFIHASKIHHAIYLPSIQTGTKEKITHRIVRDYFDSVPPNKMLYYLRYEEESDVSAPLGEKCTI